VVIFLTQQLLRLRRTIGRCLQRPPRPDSPGPEVPEEQQVADAPHAPGTSHGVHGRGDRLHAKRNPCVAMYASSVCHVLVHSSPQMGQAKRLTLGKLMSISRRFSSTVKVTCSTNHGGTNPNSREKKVFWSHHSLPVRARWLCTAFYPLSARPDDEGPIISGSWRHGFCEAAPNWHFHSGLRCLIPG